MAHELNGPPARVPVDHLEKCVFFWRLFGLFIYFVNFWPFGLFKNKNKKWLCRAGMWASPRGSKHRLLSRVSGQAHHGSRMRAPVPTRESRARCPVLGVSRPAPASASARRRSLTRPVLGVDRAAPASARHLFSHMVSRVRTSTIALQDSIIPSRPPPATHA